MFEKSCQQKDEVFFYKYFNNGEIKINRLYDNRSNTARKKVKLEHFLFGFLRLK